MCPSVGWPSGKRFHVRHKMRKCFFHNHFFLKSWQHTWNDPRIKSKTSRSSVFTCSGMNANTIKLIPNRGIRSSVDFASLLKRQSKSRFKCLPKVKPIFNLSLYMPIMKCNCGVLFILHFSSEDQRWGKNTIKSVSGKIAHALWLAYEMLSITGKIMHRAPHLCVKQLPCAEHHEFLFWSRKGLVTPALLWADRLKSLRGS